MIVFSLCVIVYALYQIQSIRALDRRIAVLDAQVGSQQDIIKALREQWKYDKQFLQPDKAHL